MTDTIYELTVVLKNSSSISTVTLNFIAACRVRLTPLQPSPQGYAKPDPPKYFSLLFHLHPSFPRPQNPLTPSRPAKYDETQTQIRYSTGHRLQRSQTRPPIRRR